MKTLKERLEDAGWSMIDGAWRKAPYCARNQIEAAHMGGIISTDMRRRLEAVDQITDEILEYSGEFYVRDLIADVIHYCDALGFDFEEELEAARGYHATEVNESRRAIGE